jgi:hypothetical protein
MCVSPNHIFLGKGDKISQRFSKIEFWLVLTSFQRAFPVFPVLSKIRAGLGWGTKEEQEGVGFLPKLQWVLVGLLLLAPLPSPCIPPPPFIGDPPTHFWKVAFFAFSFSSIPAHPLSRFFLEIQS